MDRMETLVNDLVTAVLEKTTTIVPELCHGCAIDHPSQKQHDVCLADDEEIFWKVWHRMDLEPYTTRLGVLIEAIFIAKR